MRDLEKEYGEQVDFVIVPAEETQQRQSEIEEYGFAAQLHGLVTFDAEGEAVAKLPGHSFGREEILAAMQSAMPAATNGG